MKKAKECLTDMKDRLVRENVRMAKEHVGMYGWQKLAHEKARALDIAESVKLKTLDALFS